MDAPRIRRRVRVTGRVQGVAFRAATVAEAREEGVDGWVRNLPDGRVEAVFEGPQPAVERLVAFCRRGPPAARVTDVEVEEPPPGSASAGSESVAPEAGFHLRR